MAKPDIFKVMKYGAAAMSVFAEVNEALADSRLTAEEALRIIKTAVDGADIKGLDIDLIKITSRDDGGFTIDFPHAAIKDWALDIDM